MEEVQRSAISADKLVAGDGGRSGGDLVEEEKSGIA